MRPLFGIDKPKLLLSDIGHFDEMISLEHSTIFLLQNSENRIEPKKFFKVLRIIPLILISEKKKIWFNPRITV